MTLIAMWSLSTRQTDRAENHEVNMNFGLLGRCSRGFGVRSLGGRLKNRILPPEDDTPNSHHYYPLPILECRLRDSRFLLTAGITLLIFICLARSGNASSLSILLTQSPTATLSGTALDEQGAVVPD